jgi:hypothetical protein
MPRRCQPADSLRRLANRELLNWGYKHRAAGSNSLVEIGLALDESERCAGE